MNNLNTGEKEPSFWSKVEGKITLGILGVVAFFGIKHIDTFMQHLLNIVTNTVYTVIALGVLGLLLFLFTSKSVRTGLFFLWKMFIRKTFGLIIEMDPIAILKIQINEAEEEREKMSTQIDKAEGAKSELERQIEANVEQAEKKLKEADIAMRQGNKAYANVAATEAAGLRDMNTRLIPIQQNLNKVVTVMEKVYENSGVMIEQMKVDVKLKETEYKAITAGHSALKSALRIFKGDPDKAMMYDQAIEYINSDMGQKVGEMKRIMKMTKNFMSSIDVQNAYFNEEGMKMLEQYQNGEFKLLTQDNKVGSDLSSLNTKQTISITPSKQISSSYSKLLGDD